MRINRKEILNCFDDYIREDYKLNNSYWLDNEEWLFLLIKTFIEYYRYQINVLNNYYIENTTLVKGRLETLDKQFTKTSELLNMIYDGKEV